MGYDMRWCNADPGERQAVAAARETFRRAVAARDALPESERGSHIGFERAKREGIDPLSEDAYDGMSPRYRAAAAQVHAACDAISDADRSYFRLSMHGMGIYCDLMYRIGMVFDDEPHPDWPEPEDFGITGEDYDALKYPEDYPGHTWTDEKLAAALKYKDAHDAVLAWHGRTDTPGIPAHKFSGNDGWHVLAPEAEAAVRIWQKFVEDNSEDKALAIVAETVGDTGYWLEWVAWLLGSVKHDGFAVR